jgi:hypothetical protein
MKRWLKWIIFPLSLAIAAETLLLGLADAFGKGTGEMSLNIPSAIWFTWHLPGIALGFLVFGRDAVGITVLLFTTGILQFFVIFWLAIAIGTWTKRTIRKIEPPTK